MSKQRTQSSESQHQSTMSQQAPQGPVTEDAGVAHAEQVGNGAMQEEMQGQEEGQSEAEGAFDWVVDKGKEAVGDIWEAVEEWGLEQLDSVQAILTYVDTVGIEGAMPLLVQVGSDLVTETVLHMVAEGTNHEALWRILDWLQELPALERIPHAKLALLAIEATSRSAHWLYLQLATLDASDLLQIATELDGATLEQLLQLGNDLSHALLDVAWPPGVGVSMGVGASAAGAVFALGGSYTGTLRHLGGGAIAGTIRIEGRASAGVGVGGESKGDGSAMAKLECGVDGAVECKLGAQDLMSWNGLYVMTEVLSGALPLNDVIELLAHDFPTAELTQSLEISGDVNAIGKGEVGLDVVGVSAQLGATLGALSATATNLKGEGDLLTSGTITLELSAGLFGELAGATVDVGGALGGSKDVTPEASLPIPSLQGELSADMGVRLIFDVTTTPEWTMSDIHMEEFVQANVLGAEGELGIERDLPDAVEDVTLEEKLASIRALNLSFHLPVDDATAQSMLASSELYQLIEEVGLDVEGAIDLSARLDAETTQFIAETIASASKLAEDPCEALDAWLADPTGPSLGEAATILCMELAQAADLEVTLNVSVTAETELGAEVAAGLKLGLAGELGVTVDYQTDLLTKGGAPTMSDFADLIRQAQGEAEALAAK